MKVVVFGLGFVGLTTALGLADKGFAVCGFDIDENRCKKISSGSIPFFEPGLDDALVRNLGKTFTVADTAAVAIKDAAVCFFCVGTPALSDGSADLRFLLTAIDSISGVVPANCVLAVKSTVPPGTVKEQVIPYVREKGMPNPLAANPEFLREGKCWEDFVSPDRIVCGIADADAQAILAELYRPFNAPIHFVEPNTAEFIKYLSNSLLATLISYSNEMALLADSVGSVQTAQAFQILHQDKRLAGSGINTYIYPGCGYGGYCLPKDTQALAALSQSKGFVPRILEGVISLNDEMPVLTAQKITRAAGDKNEAIGILGLSFKPGSDDVRDSSAAKIIVALIENGYCNLHAYDPLAMGMFQDMYKGLPLRYLSSAYQVCETCPTVALVTAWEEFAGIDKLFPATNFVDCRYFLGKN